MTTTEQELDEGLEITTEPVRAVRTVVTVRPIPARARNRRRRTP
ncbi:hypothetical protein ACTWQF_08285 [Streptomyces sp. 8N114]